MPRLPNTVVETTNSVFESIFKERKASLEQQTKSSKLAKQWLTETIQKYAQLALEEDRQPAKKKPKVDIAIPDEIVERINSLKVKDLQNELRQRNQCTVGLKKDLRERLLEIVKGEYNSSPSVPPSVSSAENDSHANGSLQVQSLDKNMSMESKKVVEGQETTNHDIGAASIAGGSAEQKSTDAIEEPSANVEQAQKENYSTSIAETDESSKEQISNKSSVDEEHNSDADEKHKPMDEFEVSGPKEKPKATKPISPSRLLPYEKPLSQSMKINQNKNNLFPSSTNIASNGTTSAVGRMMKQNSNPILEARKAKIAEMRSKSKPVTTSTVSINAVPSLSQFKSTAGSHMKANDGKKKLLAAQMREKALRKNEELSNDCGFDQQVKENSPNSPNSVKNNQERKAVLKGAILKQTSPNSTKPDRSIALKKATEILKSPKLAKTPTNAKSNPSNNMSPLDTYELSDREQSDSEDEEEQETKSTKRIPDWAKKEKLIPALEHQYTIGQDSVDPDQIFGEVQTCDLQAIFDQKKARYQRRTSSGNWTQDRATAAEKLSYKRTMRYNGEI